RHKTRSTSAWSSDVCSSDLHLTSIFRTLGQNAGVDEKRHEEMSIMIGELKGLMTKLDRIESVENRMRDMEKEMRSIRNELTARLDRKSVGRERGWGAREARR